MQELAPPRYLPFVRWIFSVILAASTVFFMYRSIHWQVMWDPSIMHYVNFLMDQGWAPYRDIVDINLPGSYLVEGWAMHVFGGGDLAWRLYDFSLLAVLIGSLVVIALPYDWFAGLFAGAIFLLIHGAEGSRNAGQREQVMITLIMAAYACLFTAMRRGRPWLLLPFGFLAGFAASFKPTAAPLGLALLVLMVVVLRKKHEPVKSYLAYGLAGLLASALLTLNFLYQHHAFGDFVTIARRLVPYYASVGNTPFPYLVRVLLSPSRLVMFFLGLFLLLGNAARNQWESWERGAIGVGILWSGFSFLAQGKDFEHHAYAIKVFLLLWFGLEAVKALRIEGWRRRVALAGLAVGVLIIVPFLCYKLTTVAPLAEQQNAIVDDLVRLGGPRLQRQVQCLDMVDGCNGALYRLQLLPNTGILGDYMFLGPPESKPETYYRDLFWRHLQADPPKVIVLTNMWLANGNSFDKIKQWPELEAYLETAYTLDASRSFGVSAYRIYLLREKPVAVRTSPPL